MPWRVSKALYVSACVYLSRRMVFRYILHVNRKKKLENDGFEVHLIKKPAFIIYWRGRSWWSKKLCPPIDWQDFFLGCKHQIEYHLSCLTLYISKIRFGTEIQYLFNQYTNFIWIYNLSVVIVLTHTVVSRMYSWIGQIKTPLASFIDIFIFHYAKDISTFLTKNENSEVESEIMKKI